MRLSFESKYCAAHEAIFELFIGWPNYGLIELPAIGVDAQVKRDRPFFFMPIAEAIDFEPFGKKFQRLYLRLRIAIEAGWLKSTSQMICGRTIYVMPLWNAVVFALRGGLRIRRGVQKELGIRQDVEAGLPEKVRDATRAQYLLIRNGDNLVDPVCKKIKGQMDPSTLRKYIRKQFFDEPGENGRPSCERDAQKNGGQYQHRVISDVCAMQGDGIMKYQFTLLKEVVSVIANEIVASMDKESIRQMCVDDFLEKLGSDSIAKLYLKNAPEVVFHFIYSIVEEVFSYAQDLLRPRLSEQLKALSFG